MLLKFTNCYLLKEEKLVYDDLYIEDGIIIDPVDLFYKQKRYADKIISCSGCIISPGFIDIQTNGAIGIDFSNPDSAVCEIKSSMLAKYYYESGTTSICPTIITSSKESYKKISTNLNHFLLNSVDIRKLGLHMEGPFLSVSKCGMHSKVHIHEFSENPSEDINEIYGNLLDLTRIVTLAPELRNADKAIDYLLSRNIKVAVGHTSAHMEQMQDAFCRGVNLVTHLYNAMESFHHRDPNILGSIIDNPHVYAGIIADKIHSHPKALKLAEIASAGRVVLVTDSMLASGLEDGNYRFGDSEITVESSIAYVKDTRTLAGATKDLIKCVESYWQEACDKNLPFQGLATALAAASSRPAQALDVENTCGLKIGFLKYGWLADLVFIDANVEEKKLKILSTWLNGNIKFSSNFLKF